ncbi:hypothetical protein PFISCL1PPCAC_22768 [Pristionchus fissidentatus]|uniref:Membrane transporter n=1 Tax=Pristionchus fissidentatus TaxID=1538716 RepID=A0AAV5WGT9_9BILA|nr:hypothetical protein PFISCL1PPCAC_22768 [Pristionchus fissidentatus]
MVASYRYSQPLRSFDEIFTIVGGYGKYQLMMLLVFQFSMINLAGNYIFVSFASLRPTCSDENLQSTSADVCSTLSTCSNLSRPSFHTLFDDGEFVCPASTIPHNLQTIQAIGSAFGALIGGHLADEFGRKWVTFSGAVQMVGFGLLGAVSPNWYVLAVAMAGMGFSYGVYNDVGMALASESVGVRYRILQTLGFQWSIALMVNSLLAYLTASWRGFLTATNVLGIPILFILPFWLESPRWLIQRKRTEEAANSLNTMLARNGESMRFTGEDLADIELDDSESRTYSFSDLFSSRQLSLYSLVMVLSALTIEISVAIIIFDVQVLTGNPFINIALYGALRLWVPPFLFLTDGTTLALFLVSLLLQDFLSPIVRSALLILAGIVNSGIHFTIYKQYCIELFPTVMRGVAVGSFGVVEKIGGAIAPQLIILSHQYWPGISATIAVAILAASLISGYCILPETSDQNLPDTKRTVPQ